MARFVDLDEDEGHGEQLLRHNLHSAALENGWRGLDGDAADSRAPPSSSLTAVPAKAAAQAPERVQNEVTRAFQCYPIVHAIVSSIDLTTLDALARASYFIHDGLIQYRQVLVESTLHCSNEDAPVDRDETLRYRARAGNWFYMEDGRSYNGKSGHCARDLVGGCRRCGEVVCRNCAIKPPAPLALRERHRRLCVSCVRAPIAALAKPPLDPKLPFSSERVQATVCKCDTEGVWLCQPCGRSIRGADHEYQRIWRWRNHYGEVLGGLGTGIGDGDRGVICGRESDCCAAKEREQETDCDAEDARDADYFSSSTTTPSSPPSTTAANHNNPLEAAILAHERTPSPQLGPGYERHEIEGIGGVVKRKLVRMVRVGACVPEWEDERGVGKRALGREVRGDVRSWCGWCWRVIPGREDQVAK